MSVVLAINDVTQNIVIVQTVGERWRRKVEMRLLYTLLMIFLWAIMTGMTGGNKLVGVSDNVKFLALAIMIAGAMAGGDGK